MLGFLAAAIIGAAVAAVGGAVTMRLFHTSAPLLSIWHVWFLSDGLGIITIAPLLIGLGRLGDELPSWREFIEGTLALLVLAAMATYNLTQIIDEESAALVISFKNTQVRDGIRLRRHARRRFR